jgi:DNA-binding SARP family transcriptional activator
MPHDVNDIRWGAAVAAAPFRLELLGEARLLGAPGGATVRLERKAAALVALLALEGPLPRQRLAALLWEDSEETARANMRQLLRRLKVATGVPLADGKETLALAEGVAVDALELRRHVEAGRFAEALAVAEGAAAGSGGSGGGVLLGTFTYGDMGAFDAWLEQARGALLRLVRQAVAAEVERHEAAGRLPRALALAERHLSREPTSEETYRLLMRLHYLAGDRAAALGSFEACKAMLSRELGAAPSEQTLSLARELGRAQAPQRPAAPGVAASGATGAGAAVAPRSAVTGRPVLPPSVLRPPVLAGREAEWARAEEAWAAGQGVYFGGPGGIGKSRLARDFAASKGAAIYFQGRPGDEQVPFATMMRNFRHMFSLRPDVAATLEPWVRAELGRVMPEFADPSGALPPAMVNDGDRVRFYEAMGHCIRRCMEGLSAQVYDDFQYFDPASVAAGEYIFGNAYPYGEGARMPHLVVCFRTDELTAHSRTVLERMTLAGTQVMIDLAPLSEAQVATLLEGTAVPGAARLAPALARYTGGNPLFVTEALRHLLESGGGGLGEEGLPERLLPQLDRKVAAVVRRRMERLSRPALRLAQVAALARAAFSLEVAGEVLEVPALELDAPLGELTAAQVFRSSEPGGGEPGSGEPGGTAFSHDLLFEAVLAGIPAPIGRLLHQRLALALEKRGAPPAVVAHHWAESAEPQRAVPFFHAAARVEEATLRHQEAALLRQRAERLRGAGGPLEA